MSHSQRADSDEEWAETPPPKNRNRKYIPDREFSSASSSEDFDGDMRADTRHVKAKKSAKIDGKLKLVMRRDDTGQWKSQSKVRKLPLIIESPFP